MASSLPGWPGGRSRSCHGTAVELRGRRVPRVVGVGERHPAEPRLVGAERGQPVDRDVGHPIGVVPLARDGVVLRLGRAGVATGRTLEQAGEAVQVLGMVLAQPAPVVRDRMVAPGGRVHRLLRALEAAPRAGVVAGHARVLLEPEVGVEAGLEVGLAEQGGAVARLVVEVLRDGGGVFGQRDPVGHDAVGPDVLAGQHRRARRHAHRVLVVGAPEVDALGGQLIDDGRARHRAAVAAQAVVALLIGRDEEDVAAASRRARVRLRHRRRRCRRRRRRASRACSSAAHRPGARCDRAHARGACAPPRSWVRSPCR